MESEDLRLALRNVPLFAPLDDESLDRIASTASSVEVRSDDWLFHEGDPASALYVVLAGKLEVCSGSGEASTALRVLRRGAVLGELAVLTGGRRSAAVRARRDCQLLRLGRGEFEALCDRQPAFRRRLTESLATQLAESQGRTEPAPRRSTTVLVPGEPGAPVAAVAARLAGLLGDAGSLAVLHGEDDERNSALRLDHAEADAERVLLVALQPIGEGDSWTEFCIRQADRIVLVSRCANPPSYPSDSGAQAGAEILVVGRGPALPSWIEGLRPALIHRVGEQPGFARLERLARRLSERALGAVLSAGGARAFAHIGILAEIEAAGYVVDRVGACSMGSTVGALYAGGLSPEQIREFAHARTIEGNHFLRHGSRAVEVLARELEEHLEGARIEDLARDFFCVSTDLGAGELVVHRNGSLAEACHASMALPAVATPAVQGERVLVDGAVLNGLPVDIMDAEQDGPILASDVTGRSARMARWVGRWVRSAEDQRGELPLFDVAVQALDVASQRSIDEGRQRASLVFEPEVPYGTLAFDKLDDLIAAGRRHAQAILEASPAPLSPSARSR